MTFYCFAETIYESQNSTLYLGFNKDKSQQVVFKCFDKDAQNMYLREMSGFGMEHPNLVLCLDTFYLNDGRPCVMYEFFEDGTLEDWIREHKKADVDFCYQCLEEILQALVYLNQNKRIHCDIKPGNIFLRQNPKTKKLSFILGDLGATCSLREALESRYGVGTPAYIAPERLYDKFFYNSDLYSLGIVIFELFTGERPFLGTPEEVKRAHITKQPNLEQITDLALCHFIGRLLEKEPESRIVDAETALSILTAMRNGERISKSTGEPVQKKDLKTQQIFPNKIEQKYQFTVNLNYQKLLAFDVNQELIVGVDFDNHIELINPKTDKRDIVLKNGDPQTSHCSCLFYANSLKIYHFDLETYQAESIYQFNKAINYFRISHDYLLLRSKYDNIYCHLTNKKLFKFHQSHYFGIPEACILDNGDFCLSAGSANNELIFRNKKAEILTTWELKGPIISLVSSSGKILALTLDMQNSNHCWLYSLNAQKPYDVDFSHQEIAHYCRSEDVLFWVDYKNQFYMCDQSLKSKPLFQLEKDLTIDTFQFSPNHNWFVVLSTSSNQKHLVTCFKADGELLHV